MKESPFLEMMLSNEARGISANVKTSEDAATFGARGTAYCRVWLKVGGGLLLARHKYAAEL